MKKLIVLFAAVVLSATTLQATSIGSWKAYLAYTDITEIERVGNELFVLASKNLYLYNTQDQSIRTFSKMDALSDCSIAHIAWNQKAKRLIVIYENKNIDLLEPNGNCTNMPEYYMKSITGDKTINDIYIYDQFAYLSTGFGILKINASRAEISDTYQLGFNVNYSYIENGKIYAANLNANLLDKSSWTFAGDFTPKTKTLDPELLDMVKNLNTGGPKYGYFEVITSINNTLYTTNGFNQQDGIVQIMKDDKWTLLETENISKTTGLTFPGIACIDVDPLDENRLFVCSRNGLYEFKNGQFTAHYNHKNSPIEIFDQVHEEYELVTGLKFDNEGNLWILNSQAPTQAIIQLDRQGKWSSHYQADLMKLNDAGFLNKSLAMLEKMVLDSKNRLWFVNDHWNLPSLYCYNPATDKLDSYTKIVNQDGTSYAIGDVHCVAEDKDGNVWAGTNMGAFYLDPTQFGSSDPVFTQVKVPRNDGTNYADYLLNGLDISSIKIDAAGRKWFGTYGNGVYLISADNMTQIHHFTANNSKLFSDYIEDIAINEKTGEVFFSTSEGLCSFMSDATTAYETIEKNNVYAYPNPVRPDYTGLITIVGLSNNADIKIVTANGALVAEGRSNGGTFTWDGRDQTSGRRVASGVYMVMAATAEGKKGAVCKIAIVNP